jgi:hypothetical protein
MRERDPVRTTARMLMASGALFLGGIGVNVAAERGLQDKTHLAAEGLNDTGTALAVLGFVATLGTASMYAEERTRRRELEHAAQLAKLRVENRERDTELIHQDLPPVFNAALVAKSIANFQANHDAVIANQLNWVDGDVDRYQSIAASRTPRVVSEAVMGRSDYEGIAACIWTPLLIPKVKTANGEFDELAAGRSLLGAVDAATSLLVAYPGKEAVIGWSCLLLDEVAPLDQNDPTTPGCTDGKHWIDVVTDRAVERVGSRADLFDRELIQQTS